MVIQATQALVVIAVGQELAAIAGSQESPDIQALVDLVGSAVTLDSQELAVIQGSPVNLVTLVSPESRAIQVILVFPDTRVTVESLAIPVILVFLATLDLVEKADTQELVGTAVSPESPDIAAFLAFRDTQVLVE